MPVENERVLRQLAKFGQRVVHLLRGACMSTHGTGPLTYPRRIDRNQRGRACRCDVSLRNCNFDSIPGEDTALAGLLVLDVEADGVLGVARGREAPGVSRGSALLGSLDVDVTDVELVTVLDDLVRAGRLVRASVHLDSRVQLELPCQLVGSGGKLTNASLPPEWSKW